MNAFVPGSGDNIIDITAHTNLNKRFLDGTHRLCPPEETLKRITPHLPAIGITRIADVTGLDNIGIPVCMAVRPNSRALSVSQGKGITLELAKVSAVMESIESFHAENIDLPVVRASFREFSSQNQFAADPARLVSNGSTIYHPELDLFWIEGIEMLSGRPIWVPLEAVSTDLTANPESGLFINSNGLASGNHLLEAVSHAICEVVERDSTAFFRLGLNKSAKSVSPESVNFEAFKRIFFAIHQAGLELSIINLTHEFGIPTFESLVIDPSPSSQVSQSKISGGLGSHLCKEVALLRAVTEAIQTRLTYIAGSRDDILKADYSIIEFRSFQEIARNQTVPKSNQPAQDFAEIPSLETDSLDLDVQRQLDLLHRNGIDQVIMVDLTKPEYDIPVVRVVIPGMEFLGDMDINQHTNDRSTNLKAEQIMSQLEELM